MPQVEHRELRYFVAVAEELHFTRAARRLDMSQPPLSAAIAHLESKLGTQLFDRDSRHVRLTPAGAVLLGRARPILRQVDEAVAAARQAERTAVLRVAADAASAVVLVPVLALALARSDDPVELQAQQLRPAEIPSAVLAGVADVGVFVTGGPTLGLAMQLLTHDPPVAVFAASHPLARRRRVNVAELAAYRLALWPEEDAPDAHRLVRSLFDGVVLRKGVAVLPMYSGEWAEELEAGAFCVLPAAAPILREYRVATITGVDATFDTWLAWSEQTPPQALESVRRAAEAVTRSG